MSRRSVIAAAAAGVALAAVGKAREKGPEQGQENGTNCSGDAQESNKKN
ncbi:MAG TPA: hypothetical protein VIL71_01170 [Spirillospora sp.]